LSGGYLKNVFIALQLARCQTFENGRFQVPADLPAKKARGLRQNRHIHPVRVHVEFQRRRETLLHPLTGFTAKTVILFYRLIQDDVLGLPATGSASQPLDSTVV